MCHEAGQLAFHTVTAGSTTVRHYSIDVHLLLQHVTLKMILNITRNLTHSSGRRLKMRLKFSFDVPCMRKLCNAFVQRCDSCQRKSRVTYRDKTPITAIPRIFVYLC